MLFCFYTRSDGEAAAIEMKPCRQKQIASNRPFHFHCLSILKHVYVYLFVITCADRATSFVILMTLFLMYVFNLRSKHIKVKERERERYLLGQDKSSKFSG